MQPLTFHVDTRRVWLDSISMCTEAGDMLKRRQVSGPWFPDDMSGNRLCSHASLAIAVASDSSRKWLAVKQFESLMFNSGTIATKEFLFSLWSKLCSALGHRPLPVTRDSLVEAAAVLRASGYRATMSYLYEARFRHLRSSLPWDGSLDGDLAHCKCAAVRAIGPPCRAQEVKADWWTRLISVKGLDPLANEVDEDAPLIWWRRPWDSCFKIFAKISSTCCINFGLQLH